MSEAKEKGPARGFLRFGKYSANYLRMSPQCHPGANFKLTFSTSERAEGLIEIQCAECSQMFANVRLGR